MPHLQITRRLMYRQAALFVSVLGLSGFMLAGCSSPEPSSGGASSASPVSAAAPSTADPEAGDSGTPTMVTFGSDNVSITLPDSFTGGNPKDPSVRAELDALFSARDIPLNLDAEMEGGLELIMLSDPGPDGWIPLVTVKNKNFDTHPSMEAWANSYPATFHMDEVTIESLTPTSARVVGRISLGDFAVEEYWVFRQVGSRLYIVESAYDMESTPEMGSVYRASEESISIRGE